MSRRRQSGAYEVTLKVCLRDQGEIEILRQVLADIGIGTKDIVECVQWPDACLSVYYHSQSKAYGLKQKLRAFHLRHVSIKVSHLLRKEWQTKWKKGLKPFTLSKWFDVVPIRLKTTHRLKGREPIYIDTDLAFGSGLHATTRFMARLIERCRGRFQSFLDIGTGTGILAIVASKCDCPYVNAVDISSSAVKVARANFNANRCRSVHVKVGDARKIKIQKQYDFVCANIITRDLMEMGEKIIGLIKPGKYLAVSGISLNSYDMFRKDYARHPLKCLKIEKGEGWAAILYRKLPSTVN